MNTTQLHTNSTRFRTLTSTRKTPRPIGKSLNPSIKYAIANTLVVGRQDLEDPGESPGEDESNEPVGEELEVNEDGLVIFPTITKTIWDTETTATTTVTIIEEQETIIDDRKSLS